MTAVVVESYGSWVVGIIDYDSQDLVAVAEKGYEIIPRSNGVQIARCGSLNDALDVVQDVQAELYS